jgi:hypothetical protein
MTQEISTLGKNVSFAPTAAPETERARAVQVAGQIPQLDRYGSLAGLSLQAGRNDRLMLSFHALGPRFRGIIGVVAYLAIEGKEPDVLEGGTFQINYEEDLENAQKRFSNWLERMIVEGLNKWRESL